MTTCAQCQVKDELPKYSVSYWISKIPPAENPEKLHEACVDPFIAARYPDAWKELAAEASDPKAAQRRQEFEHAVLLPCEECGAQPGSPCAIDPKRGLTIHVSRKPKKKEVIQ